MRQVAYIYINIVAITAGTKIGTGGLYIYRNIVPVKDK